ncbi:MAG: TetR/AcrR family transcriptional regulator [Rhodomicrobium sp.]
MPNTKAARSPRKARGQGAERREEILEAAQRLFAAHGFDAVSTRRIASEVGISQAALFGYFPTRDDLSAELCIRALTELEERIGDAASHLPSPDAELQPVFAAYIDFALENPDRYRLAFMFEQSADGEFLKRTGGRPLVAGLRTFERLRNVISAHRSNLGRSGLDELITCSIWASLHGLASLLIARPEFPWGDRTRLIAVHLELAAASARF